MNRCAAMLVYGKKIMILPFRRDIIAIGGLSGGEEKDTFWRIVAVSASHLPEDKLRYLMVDLVAFLCFAR